MSTTTSGGITLLGMFSFYLVGGLALMAFLLRNRAADGAESPSDGGGPSVPEPSPPKTLPPSGDLPLPDSNPARSRLREPAPVRRRRTGRSRGPVETPMPRYAPRRKQPMARRT